MKKILYYITDHGLGHATRSVAIIRELQKLGFEVIIRNSNAKQFLEQSIPQTKIIEGKTDVGPIIQNNGISIDTKKSIISIDDWINSIELIIEKEIKIIQQYSPNLIISDISPMPFLAANKLNIASIAISNFSWYDVLKFLPQPSLDKLHDFYNFATTLIQLPLGTKMNHFRQKHKAGIVSRVSIHSKSETREKIGVGNSEKMVLIILGNSKNSLNITSENNVKIVSVISNKIPNAINLSNWIEGQELISASDLVICKCGYGVISECLTTGTPFQYIHDPNHLEQNAISNELSKLSLNNKITFKELNEIHFDEIFVDSFVPPKKISNDNKNVAEYILKFI